MQIDWQFSDADEPSNSAIMFVLYLHIIKLSLDHWRHCQPQMLIGRHSLGHHLLPNNVFSLSQQTQRRGAHVVRQHEWSLAYKATASRTCRGLLVGC